MEEIYRLDTRDKSRLQGCGDALSCHGSQATNFCAPRSRVLRVRSKAYEDWLCLCNVVIC
jgi:hypothetical protein